MRPMSAPSQRDSFGSARVVVVCVLVAVGVAAAVAMRMVSKGASDVGYIIAFSLASVVGMALVAPKFFTGKSQEPADFSEEIEKLHSESASGNPPKKRKWQ